MIRRVERCGLALIGDMPARIELAALEALMVAAIAAFGVALLL